MRKLLPAAALLLLMSACNSVPDGILKPKKMEQVLYETHIAEALIDEYPSRYRTADDRQQLVAAVFRDNGITKAQFDTSMVYYSAHLDRYMKIYDRVTDRLNADAERAQEAKLAYDRLLLTPVGDSVDIWRRSHTLIVDPLLGAASQQFEIKGDSNFHANDLVAWNLRLHNLPDSTSGYLCATLGYSTKDTVVVDTYFLKSDTTLTLELALPLLSDASKKLFGALTLLGTQTPVISSAPRFTSGFVPIFVDQISLMRYHQSDDSDAVADSVAVDSLAADSLPLADSLAVADSARLMASKADTTSVKATSTLPAAPSDGSAVKAAATDMPKPLPRDAARVKKLDEIPPEGTEVKSVRK